MSRRGANLGGSSLSSCTQGYPGLYDPGMLVGRSREIGVIERLLSEARTGQGGALVIRGEAGVGKSALLRFAQRSASDFVVLRAVGIESEAELAFAGLHQLLSGALDHLDALPTPQSAALRSAFGLSDDTVAERFRIALGVLGLLAAVADERPVLCVLDDAQWLDEASLAALLFVARRLEAEPIALVFAAREGVDRPFVAAGVAELVVGPLSAADARLVAAERLGTAASPTAVEWVLAHANGNPLALLELPEALSAEQLAGRAPITGLVAPATSVERTYLERVGRLPVSARDWALLIAAEESGDRATISRAAAALGLRPDDLVAAEAAGLVVVESDRMSFRHPLMRSAVYRGAAFTAREAAHRALADALVAAGDADRRAWHLALSTSGIDDGVAAELESTADRAQRRAGYAGAATAFERSARLSSAAADRTRRTVRAARAAWQAGQRERATALLGSVSHVHAEPVVRAEREHLLGLVQLSCGSQQAAGTTLLAAAGEMAPHDPHVALELLLDAGLAAGRSGDAALMGEAGARAEALALTTDLDETLRDLLLGVGTLTIGRSVAQIERLRMAVARAPQHTDARLLGWAAFAAAAIGAPGTDAALVRSTAAARAFGAVPAVILIQETLVVATHIAGRYSFVAEAEEALRLAGEAGLTNAATALRAFLCWAAALRGADELCRRYADDVSIETANGMAMANSTAQWALALLELAGGAADRSATRLAGLRTAGVGQAHPLFVLMSTADLVEACVQAGRPADAAEAVRELEDFARPDAPTWARALAARCRALLAGSEQAASHFEDGLGLLSGIGRPFDTARTRLAYGSFLRRQRRRAEARTHLRAAVESFERLGADPWAERARVELRATGESARKRDPSTVTQLTPQEMQIARLVGEGNSNRDVATQLFLSPRTVEYHLAKVFTKLGITSRADLIRQAAVLEPVG
jgi:DNA-binding CsgD family transcriptional regulator